jgi:hypothetical protein
MVSSVQTPFGTSELAASFDFPSSRINMEFIIANPSFYTYLDERRFPYTCGYCHCTLLNCTCDQDCTDSTMKLGVPVLSNNSVCHDRQYNHWPYGVEFVTSHDDVSSIPYALQAGLERCLRKLRVGTLCTWWDRTILTRMAYQLGMRAAGKSKISCRRSGHAFGITWTHVGPAMLEGPNRRTRGLRFKKYLELYYGRPTHVLHDIPGVAHNATAMFGSPVGLRELFH